MIRTDLHRAALPVAVALSLLLAGCGDDDAPPAASTATSGLETLEVGAETGPSELRVDGLVEAVNQATLSAQTAGRVAEVKVEVDDHVARGDVLVRLRATEQVSGLEQARAALAAATAREAQARAQYDRIHDMYERKVVARATYDEALAGRETAAAQLAAARAAVESAREGVAYTEVRAPYAGVVTARSVHAGEAVAPGVPLVSVAALDRLRVVADVPQGAAAALRAKPEATVYVGDDRVIATHVTLYPAAEPGSGTFRARVDLPDDTGLAPGMYAKVGFVTGEASRLLVPRAAVVERSELRAVYVVRPDGRVALRQVRLGRPAGDRVEVIAGLARGEKVALDPASAGLQARAAAQTTHD